MYTLEFYDKIRDIEYKYNFSNPISLQQALDIFNKIGFEVYPYTKVEQPLSRYDNKYTPIDCLLLSIKAVNSPIFSFIPSIFE